MPAKVLLAARASVTAGLANDIDDVSQYVDVMYSATANGVIVGRLREQLMITARRPKVATNSLHHCFTLGKFRKGRSTLQKQFPNTPQNKMPSLPQNISMQMPDILYVLCGFSTCIAR